METFHQLPLRKCRKFIGDLGERFVHDYFKYFSDLYIEEIFYQQAGFGDFRLIKKTKYKEYITKVEKIEGEAPLLTHWNSLEENYPDIDRDLLAVESEYMCRIDVKTSLGKYPRSTNILTPSQKNRPNYHYILKVKLIDEINEGFSGELNQDDLEIILKDQKINKYQNNIDKTVKIDINKCNELVHRIGIYLLKDYYTSNKYFVEIMQGENIRPYLLVYPSKEIQKQLDDIRIRATYMESAGGWMPPPHHIPIEYLVKCKNATEAEKMAKAKDMVNLGYFRLLKKKEECAPNLFELYQGGSFFVWDYKRQSRDYDNMLSANADIVNVKITIDRMLISDYQDSDMFNKKVHLDINNKFTKGFQAQIKTER